ncbi:hypothetical protein ACINNAV57_0199 [Acinetobacter baumannii Naval-57]|nr:hypothetical protein ACINNAV57_0199 [Acinetobacter baumannii Naval-57]
MVNNAVNDRDGHVVMVEELAPVREVFIRGQNDRLLAAM